MYFKDTFCENCGAAVVLNYGDIDLETRAVIKKTPHVVCDTCGDLARENRRRSLNWWKDKERINDAGFPEDLIKWDSIKGNNTLYESIKAAQMRWLWISGSHGTCKTRALCALGAELLIRKRWKVAYYRAVDLGTKVSALYSKSVDKAEAFQRKLAWGFDLIIIDDLGKEVVTPRVIEFIYGLVDARAVSRKPLWFSTNLDGDSLERLYKKENHGPAILRRLRENCETIQAFKKDMPAIAKGGN